MALPSWAFPREVERGVTEPTEATLARAAAAGDRSAFARLVEVTKRPVYGLCLRLLGEAEEARDAGQEAYARAWAALRTFGCCGAIRGFRRVLREFTHRR